jgi:hypothetical protein
VAVDVEGDLCGRVAELGRDVLDILAFSMSALAKKWRRLRITDVSDLGLGKGGRPGAVPQIVRVD